MNRSQITTLGALKKANYVSHTVKEEMRNNLIERLKKGLPVFDNIIGYEDTVIPQLERAILAGHNINFLGLRGQAKTRMARQLVTLLDEYIPVIKGSEINDDPLKPLSYFGRKAVEENGDNTAIEWVHRSERYAEKLATPDVNIADLVGDLDPIKAANLKLSYSDEGVIHFGIIPRSNRGIFVINELPDLQPRIQVALFNILQEGDIQIRGFKLRFPLDVQFVFTANPEDYTNRGAIITPLKDRIQSQIFTHYPETIEIGRAITKQEVNLKEGQRKNIQMPLLIEQLIEQIAVEARSSEFVDEKSGVSARLSISAYESVVSAVERRMLLNAEQKGSARVGDLLAAIPAIVGKIEMVYEGEQEGAVTVAHKLIGSAIRSLASRYFPDFDKMRDKQHPEIRERYVKITQWFENGNELSLENDESEKMYEKTLNRVTGLNKVVATAKKIDTSNSEVLLMEYLIHVLAAYSMLDKKILEKSFTFQDYFSSIMPKGDSNRFKDFQ
ncbi:MAG: sigma 54-interacting transcriptional regulator [Cyclobacteriaceae bacterium]|nr:sigma 54-interacting transcriptional regulator [Cyclobacteriaceae bacterium]